MMEELFRFCIIEPCCLLNGRWSGFVGFWIADQVRRNPHFFIHDAQPVDGAAAYALCRDYARFQGGGDIRPLLILKEVEPYNTLLIGPQNRNIVVEPFLRLDKSG